MQINNLYFSYLVLYFMLKGTKFQDMYGLILPK